MRILVPVKSYLTRNSSKFELDSDGLSRWIGYCAVGLPLAMLYGVYIGWPFGKVCFASSISHFYYTRGFGDIFVGILFFIAIFLYNFRGKKQIDTFCATVAGFFALGVALFPTTGAPCLYHNQQARILTDMPDKVTGTFPDFFMASEWSNYLHLGSAALLFIFLAWYSFYVFASDHQDQKYRTSQGELTAVKILRNKIYRWCSYAIVIAILAIAILPKLVGDEWWDSYHLTFWFEALALAAFGIAWMVHGRAFEALKD